MAQRERIKRPYKLVDRNRMRKKGITAESWEDLLAKGRVKLEYPEDQDVMLVLEEDGTEVEDNEYFQSLPDNTTFILLFKGDRWSPFGVADEVDTGPGATKSRLVALLQRLEAEPGCIALLGEADLELLAEMDVDDMKTYFPRFGLDLLSQLQAAADRHLLEKGEIRDTLGLLKLYHKSNNSEQMPTAAPTQLAPPPKRRKK